MFRNYENPHTLQEQLEELEERYAQCDLDSEESVDLIIEMSELKERINFAWQDDEYDCIYMQENYWDEEEYYDFDIL